MSRRSKRDPSLKKQKLQLNQKVDVEIPRAQLLSMLKLLQMRAVVAWTGIAYRTLEDLKRGRYNAITFKSAILIENLYDRIQILGKDMKEIRVPILKF